MPPQLRGTFSKVVFNCFPAVHISPFPQSFPLVFRFITPPPQYTNGKSICFRGGNNLNLTQYLPIYFRSRGHGSHLKPYGSGMYIIYLIYHNSARAFNQNAGVTQAGASMAVGGGNNSEHVPTPGYNGMQKRFRDELHWESG